MDDRTREIRIPMDDEFIVGDLTRRADARGLVLFAHGSGSGRHSPRNRQVAEVLDNAGFATLLVDLLTEREQRIDEITAELRFDIPLLARRLVGTIDWLATEPTTRDLHFGLYGASTGAAAALIAAAERPEAVGAVVSRGGRPDLAAEVLDEVEAPTLLIVGGLDVHVERLNRAALAMLRHEKQLEIVHGASHLFEELGALERVAELSRQWFERWLAPHRPIAEPAHPG